MTTDLDLYGDWGAWEEIEASILRKEQINAHMRSKRLGTAASGICSEREGEAPGEGARQDAGGTRYASFSDCAFVGPFLRRRGV